MSRFRDRYFPDDGIIALIAMNDYEVPERDLLTEVLHKNRQLKALEGFTFRTNDGISSRTIDTVFSNLGISGMYCCCCNRVNPSMKKYYEKNVKCMITPELRKDLKKVLKDLKNGID